MNKYLVREGVWVAFGQLASAAGVLFGIRILTEFLSPKVFGEVILCTGLSALMLGTAVTPLMQAVLRYYPNFPMEKGGIDQLRSTTIRTLWRTILAWGIGFLFLWYLYAIQYEASPWLGPFIVALFALEGRRQLGLVLMNASRNQRLFALWQTADAWGRPLAAIGALALAGATATTVLIAFMVSTLITNALFIRYEDAPKKAIASFQAMNTASQSETLNDSYRKLRKDLWIYAAPLIPAGILGWANSQADRYLIAGMIGVGQAGLYAAIYGLVSRPFLLAGGLIEYTLRPVYYQEVSTGTAKDAKRIFYWWLGLVMITCGIGFVLFSLFHKEIAGLLLAEQYRSESWMMSWFAAGYGLFVTSLVFSRICYAYGDTRAVLMGEIITACIGLAFTWVLVSRLGMMGAAYAVPIYYCIHLVTMVFLARRSYGRGWSGARMIENQVSG